MKNILFLSVIAAVALTACHKSNTPTSEYTITFGQDEYLELSRMSQIFVTGEANSDFVIEKAVDKETNEIILAEKDGQSIQTDLLSAKKIKNHNRLQININWNPEKKERTVILYVRNGDNRGRLIINQKENDPELIGGLGAILFDPVFYDIGAKGGVIETATADVGCYIEYIQEKDGKKYEAPRDTDTSFLEADGVLSVTVMHTYEENDPNTIIASQLKIDVTPNTTGKDREIYINVWNNNLAMRGYLIVYQSAN